MTATVTVHLDRWTCPREGCDTSVTASSSNINNVSGMIAVVQAGCKKMCERVSVQPEQVNV